MTAPVTDHVFCLPVPEGRPPGVRLSVYREILPHPTSTSSPTTNTSLLATITMATAQLLTDMRKYDECVVANFLQEIKKRT